MAWFDYAAALGQGLGQGAQDFRAMRQQRTALARQERLDKIEEENRQREQLKEQLALMDPNADLSPEEAAPYMKAFGKGAFTISPTDKTRVRRRQAPSEELSALTLEDTKERRSAQKALDTMDVAAMPVDKAIRLMLRAGEDPMTSGRLSPDQVKEYLLRNPRMVSEYEKQIRDLQVKAELANIRAASAMDVAGERSRMAEVTGQLRAQMEDTRQRAAAERSQITNLIRLIQITAQNGGDTTALMNQLSMMEGFGPTATEIP